MDEHLETDLTAARSRERNRAILSHPRVRPGAVAELIVTSSGDVLSVHQIRVAEPMSQEIKSNRRTPSLIGAPRFRFGAVIALALAAGFIAWLALRNNNSSTAAQATAASVRQIKNLAASVQHPVFWLGPKRGYTYELTQTSDGKIFIRYLPSGTKVGANKPYLTVATYPFAGAYPAIQKQTRLKGAVSVKLAHGGLAVLDSRYPKSVHLAYPGVDYQVEVFDPTRARALRLVSAGQVAALGGLRTTPPAAAAKPTAASLADLKSLVNTLGHPIYWAGQKAGYTYELTQTSTGKVFVRYLPKGVKVGSKTPYLTVATYPVANAFADIQRAAKGNGSLTIKLKGGGLAVVDAQYPKSVHLAYPGSDYQVEVFDPSPARARRVASDQVLAIG